MQGENYTNILTGYKKLKKLGEGTSGEVWKVEKDNQIYALKMYKAGFESKVFEEFETMQKIEHPNIVDEYEVGTLESRACMVMEFLEGAPLTKTNPKDLSEEQQEKIITAMASALQCAHEQNIIHRDLKPDNIFLLNDGRVKILDFGVSAPISYNPHTKIVAGSYSYMSPEQLAGKVNFQGDIWSFGVCLYEWYTGIHPYQSESLEELAQKMLLLEVAPPGYHTATISNKIDFIILKCLRNRLDQRYPNFNEVLEDLKSDPVQQFSKKIKSILKRENGVKRLGKKLHAKYVMDRTLIFSVFGLMLVLLGGGLLTDLLEVPSVNGEIRLNTAGYILSSTLFFMVITLILWHKFTKQYLLSKVDDFLILSLLAANENQWSQLLKNCWKIIRLGYRGTLDIEKQISQEFLLKWFFKTGDLEMAEVINKSILGLNINNEIALAYQLNKEITANKKEEAKATVKQLLEVNPSHSVAIISEKILNKNEDRPAGLKEDYQLEETLQKESSATTSSDYQSALARQIVREGSCTLRLMKGNLKLTDNQYEIQINTMDKNFIPTAHYNDINRTENYGGKLIMDTTFVENQTKSMNTLFSGNYQTQNIEFRELHSAKLWFEFLKDKLSDTSINNDSSPKSQTGIEHGLGVNALLDKGSSILLPALQTFFRKGEDDLQKSLSIVYKLLIEHYINAKDPSSFSGTLSTNPLRFDFDNKMLYCQTPTFLFFKKRHRLPFSEIESIKFRIDNNGEKCMINEEAKTKISFPFTKTDYEKYLPVFSAFWGDKTIFEDNYDPKNKH